jgi:rubrerythrin
MGNRDWKLYSKCSYLQKIYRGSKRVSKKGNKVTENETIIKLLNLIPLLECNVCEKKVTKNWKQCPQCGTKFKGVKND